MSTSRRACLAALTGGFAVLAGCQGRDGQDGATTTGGQSPTSTAPGDSPPPGEGTETPSKLVPESAFGRVVDMVEDKGVDPTGQEPVDAAFDSALSDDTLLVFPEGQYKFQGPHTIANHDRIGLVGRGNARIVPNTVWNGKLFDVTYVGEFLLDGLDIDMRAEDTTVGLRVASERAFRIEDVEFVGRGTHPDESVFHALNAGIVSPDGEGVVRNMVAKEGSGIDRYKNGNGRGGIYVGPWNKGTITIQDCHLAEFGNNGIYASRTPGNIRVIGGVFRNNNPSSVRISGRGSRIENALIEVDPAKYTGPAFDGSNSKLRGVVVEQKTTQPDIMKPGGMVMRGCRIVFRENPTNGPPVVVWSNGKTLDIEDCEILVENDTPAVLREGLEKQGNNPPWDGDRWVRLRNTTITGTGPGDCAAVRLLDAPGSELRNCQITREGAGCTGVELIRSERALVRGGTLRTGSFPIVIDIGDDASGCLVSFADQPSIVMVGSGGDGTTFRTPSCAGGDGSAESAGACCVEASDLSADVLGGASGVGVTEVEGQHVVLQSLGSGN